MLWLTCISAPLSLSGQSKNTETLIHELMRKYEAVGLSVAVVKKGEIVYTQAFGKRNLDKNLPLSSDDLFRIASISKSFSATSFMQLVEAGKASLDEDISDLLGFKVRNPAYPEVVITMRMLLSHTSSINDSQGYFTLDAINPAQNPDWEKCFNDYRPGTSYKYCNLNYNLTGTIIEKISGERFDHYVSNHILQPLGLYGGYNVDDLDSSRFATLYEYDAASHNFTASPAAYASRKEILEKYMMGYTTPVFSPTGGMKISAPDLARYMTMHMNGGRYKGKKIISKKSAKLMQTPVNREAGYGLALQKTGKLIPGEYLVGHTGSAYGLYSMMFFEPKDKFGIVAVTNGCNARQSNGFVDFLAAVTNVLYAEIVTNP